MDDNNKLDELKNLLNKFYELYGNLFKNRKLLDNNKTYQYFGARIFEQFQIEYQVLRIKFETVENPAIYEAHVRHGLLVPRRRFGIFRNRAQKLIDRKVSQELDEYFTKQIAALERLTEALDEADSAEHRPTIFDEPPDDSEEYENVGEMQASASDGEQLSTTDETKDGVYTRAKPPAAALRQMVDVISESAGELKSVTKFREITSERTYRHKDKNITEPPKANDVDVQIIEEQKPKRKRKKRAPEPGTQPQNASESNAVQLQGQIGIEELNESAEPTPGNADKPEQ